MPTIRTYTLSPYLLTINDSPERIDYHVRSGDYLPLVATMIGFMEEALLNNDSPAVNERKLEAALRLARELRTDLRYVDSHYALTTKKPNEQHTLRSGNLL